MSHLERPVWAQRVAGSLHPWMRNSAPCELRLLAGPWRSGRFPSDFLRLFDSCGWRCHRKPTISNVQKNGPNFVQGAGHGRAEGMLPCKRYIIKRLRRSRVYWLNLPRTSKFLVDKLPIGAVISTISHLCELPSMHRVLSAG